jgi:hypothetical protein
LTESGEILRSWKLGSKSTFSIIRLQSSHPAAPHQNPQPRKRGEQGNWREAHLALKIT